MRTATLIISLFSISLIFFQSCSAGLAGELSGDQATSDQGSIGIVVALLYLVGAAFSLGVPWVSFGAFSLAALAGFVGSASGSFEDLAVWGGIAVVLAIFSLLGVREKRNKA